MNPIPEYSLELELLPAVDTAAGEHKIDSVLKQLKEGVEGIQQSENFRQFLLTMSKFHDYSIGNLILIMLQKPDATHVAGFTTWKDLHRWVKQGEKGIAIMAPCMPPKNQEVGHRQKPESEDQMKRKKRKSPSLSTSKSFMFLMSARPKGNRCRSLRCRF